MRTETSGSVTLDALHVTTVLEGTTVADVMTRDVFTLAETQSLPLAESMMGLLRVRHIPVIDAAGRLVGLLTHRDLLAAKISELAPLTDDERSTIQLSVPVARVMRREVWTVRPDTSAVAAARLMREHHFGCLPVTEGGRLAGIVTEGDLLGLVTEPPVPRVPLSARPIAHVMTSAPVTITPETTVVDARLALEQHHIHHLPVIDGGRPIGMVCERDLAIAEAIFGASDRALAAHVVSLLGNTQFRGVRPTDRLGDVVATMVRDRLDAVLVMEHDVLAGIFTLVDACRILSEQR